MKIKKSIQVCLTGIASFFALWLLWQAMRFVLVGTSSVDADRIGVAFAIALVVGYIAAYPGFDD